MKEASLHRRLLLSVALVLAAVFLVTASLTLYGTHRRIDADYDAQLIAESHLIWRLVREEMREGDGLGEIVLDTAMPGISGAESTALTQYTKWRALRIWRDGRIVTHSRNAPLEAPMMKEGFSETTSGKVSWRVYALRPPELGVQVEVWENQRNRHRLIGDIIGGMTIEAVLSLPLFLLLLTLSIRYGLRGLARLIADIDARHPSDLAPVSVARLPRELLPLLRAINHLLKRMRDSLDRERRFMDHAAHELRTPLAGLRLQGQLIAASPDDASRAASVSGLMQGIDRTASLLDDLLRLSRVHSRELRPAQTVLSDVLREVLPGPMLVAEEKAISLTVSGEVDARWHTDGALLSVLLGTLVDNAVRHTPRGGSVKISVTMQGIDIVNSGPPIDPQDLPHLFERFYRGRNAVESGSGLGLAIAREVADLLRLSLSVSSGNDGTCFRIGAPPHNWFD